MLIELHITRFVQTHIYRCFYDSDIYGLSKDLLDFL